jgi:SAM-dependent methyltransferase
MRRVTLRIPFYLPMPVYTALVNLRRRLRNQPDSAHPRLNLIGDRAVEWSWIMSRVPLGPGEALDFGSETSYLGLFAAQKGFHVTGVDLNPSDWPYVQAGLKFLQGDILTLPLPLNHYDLITNCSTVEHVGLTGRYDVEVGKPDGDFEAMARLRDIMKPNGLMLLTIPVGLDEVFPPLCRVYGQERLPRLLDGFVVEEACYWIKDDANRWVSCSREQALSFKANVPSPDARKDIYALGAFQLRKPANG